MTTARTMQVRFTASWVAAPRHFRPVAVGGRDADVRRGGDRRHRDEHADEGARLRGREREGAGCPREERDEDRVLVRMRDEQRCRPGELGELVGRRTEGAKCQGEEERRSDPSGEADGEGFERTPRERAFALDERDAEPGEWPELRAYDHCSDDEDDRVLDDPEGGDHRREQHEADEAERELGALGRLLTRRSPRRPRLRASRPRPPPRAALHPRRAPRSARVRSIPSARGRAREARRRRRWRLRWPRRRGTGRRRVALPRRVSGRR